MARLTSKQKKEIGLSPYALVFRGEKKMDESKLTVLDFSPDVLNEWQPKTIHEVEPLKNTNSISWLNVDGLQDVNLMKQISDCFNIPLNIMSDILDPTIRPKIQEFENGIFISLKSLRLGRKKIVAENISFVISNNILISFQEQPSTDFNPVFDRIKKQNTRIRRAGTDYLAFALIDIVIDNYIYIIGILGDKIDDLDNLTGKKHNELLQKIDAYKREINYVRKTIKPATELVFVLAKLDSELIHDDNRPYFKDLQSNISEAYDLTESYRETLFDQLSIYHTIMSSRLNDVMKVLTIISVIFIPITFIVGVYGMNFQYMPELSWRYGYFMSLGLIVLVVVAMLVYFKIKKWF